MGKSLNEIAIQLKDSKKKVQLIYAFNGTGKTRLSKEFQSLVSSTTDINAEQEQSNIENRKILYYNAFTEDLFYWDNDLESDAERKLKIQPNEFTNWIFKAQGNEKDVVSNFQNYVNEKIIPEFNSDFSEVGFSYRIDENNSIDNVKISKGEESNFIWCVFYSLFEQVINALNEVEPDYEETKQFDRLEYFFIDDPVSSLDDSHLIQLAVDLATLIKSNKSDLKFIITTHNPLFYNVFCNELRENNKNSGYNSNRNFIKYQLDKSSDGSFLLEEIKTDSPFSYHLFLMSEIEKAIDTGELKKYHFSFLRNVLEKTATFLGYDKWGELVPTDQRDGDNHYERRLLNLSSHSKHSGEEVAVLKDDDKNMIKYLMEEIKEKYKFK